MNPNQPIIDTLFKLVEELQKTNGELLKTPVDKWTKEISGKSEGINLAVDTMLKHVKELMKY